MSDCIFNGTAKRSPMGMSEVTLTLVDPELEEAAKFVLEGVDDFPQAAGPVAVPDSAHGFTMADSAEEEPVDSELSTTEENANEAKFAKKKRAAEKQAMTLKPGEVVVGRRLYRSGESEYLVNGRTARLRDIQDLFMGIGLGPDSYAIIEQGPHRTKFSVRSRPTGAPSLKRRRALPDSRRSGAFPKPNSSRRK